MNQIVDFLVFSAIISFCIYILFVIVTIVLKRVVPNQIYQIIINIWKHILTKYLHIWRHLTPDYVYIMWYRTGVMSEDAFRAFQASGYIKTDINVDLIQRYTK